VSSEKDPPRRLTPPEAFPDLDVALAARGVALNASAPRSRVDEPEEPLTDAVQQPADSIGRSPPHPVATLTGAVLGLALIGLLVFSVIRVSGDSIPRPAAPIINMPAPSTAVPAPVAALPPSAEPAAIPPTPEVAPPQLAADSQAVPPPTPAPPTVPSDLLIASSMTAQTMIAKPLPEPQAQITPEGSLRSLLQERFPQLFPSP
jgi:hypothetical protein